MRVLVSRVHAADHPRAGLILRSDLLHRRAGLGQRLVVELLECAPPRVLRRDRVGGEPLSVDVTVKVILQAWRRGVKVAGCTVHEVTAEVDGGPILDQAVVRIEETDTLESFAAKVHAAEHVLLPAVIARLSERFS